MYISCNHFEEGTACAFAGLWASRLSEAEVRTCQGTGRKMELFGGIDTSCLYKEWFSMIWKKLGLGSNVCRSQTKHRKEKQSVSGPMYFTCIFNPSL